MKPLALAKKAIFSPSKIPLAAKIEFLSFLTILRHGLPDVMLQFLGGIGDELLLTAVAHELKKRSPDIKIWQVSHSAELLCNNPDYTKVLNWKYWPLRYSLFLEKRRCRLSYAKDIIAGEREIPPDKHIIAELCRRANMKGNVSIRPYFFLTQSEKNTGRFAKRQIAIQCAGSDSYENVMEYKLWAVQRFQTVVNNIRKGAVAAVNFQIIQLGNKNDPKLEGVLDMRGKTSLREAASILSNCDCFIGTSGFLKHLARAVECRSVIVYGGREHSYQTGYICNENLNSFVNCAPCWRWSGCDFKKKCMDMIEPEDVLEGVRNALSKKGVPLMTEVISI